MRKFNFLFLLLTLSFTSLTSIQVTAMNLSCDEDLSSDGNDKENIGPSINDLEYGLEVIKNYMLCYQEGTPFNFMLPSDIKEELEAFLEFIEEKDIYDLDDLPGKRKATNPIELYSGVKKLRGFFHSLNNWQYHGVVLELETLLNKMESLLFIIEEQVQKILPPLQKTTVTGHVLKTCCINHCKIMGNLSYNYASKIEKGSINRKVVSPF